MPTVHPTSTLAPEVELASDVLVGPHCSLTGPVRIGAGTQLIGHNYLKGPLTIGSGNRIYPFACLGFEPQDYKFDPTRLGAGLTIGDNNIIREYVSIHRATSDLTPTRIGNDNMFMAGSHAGHDVHIGNRCVFANAVLIAGHARVEDQVNIGGSGAVAQHVRVGRLAFISGTIGATHHVPPFMVVRTIIGRIGGINLVGMRRSGMPRSEIDNVKWAFRVMFLMGNTRPRALDMLAERAADSPVIAEIASFLRSIKGAMCELEESKRSRALEEILSQSE